MARRARPAFVAAGLGLLAVAGFAAVAVAQPSVFDVAGDPVAVTADKLEADLSSKNAVLLGNVTLRRGDVVMRAARVDARFRDGGQVAWARATGGVRIDLKGSHADADEVEVDFADRRLELRGHVVVGRGASKVEAERATIDLATSKISLSQVRGTLSPTPSASSAP